MRPFRLLVFSLFGLAAGCSPAVHNAVEAMDPTTRSNWLANLSSHDLCSGYQKPWAKPETKLMIEAELAIRNVSRCNSVRPVHASHASYRSRLYARPLAAAATDLDCADFASGAEAQRFFLSRGGPTLDAHGLDRDGDGLACEWGADVARRLVPPKPLFTALDYTPTCHEGPRGGTYTITASGRKNYAGC